MGRVEKIEQEVEALSPAELAQFRAWFLEYDWAAWDGQLERVSPIRHTHGSDPELTRVPASRGAAPAGAGRAARSRRSRP
jgi:hypothetical protein